MVCRGCLDERPASVVVDTSVVINLNATGCADAILRALPNRCVVVEQVSLELQAGRDTGARTIPSGRPDEGSVLIPYARAFTL